MSIGFLKSSCDDVENYIFCNLINWPTLVYNNIRHSHTN